MRGQGTGGTLAHFQKHDKPIPGPESRGQKDGRKGDKDAGPNRSREPRDMACFVDPATRRPLGTAWKNQEPGQPAAHSSASEVPRRPPTEAPPPGNPSLPTPLPGYSPGEPRVLRPLKPLVLFPRRLGRVCVADPPPPHPFHRHRAVGQDPQALTEAEKRESVLYTVLI